MAIELAGKPIAITGASSGIGRAAALACARAGMPVAAAARREDRLRELVREIEGLGGRAIGAALDVTDGAACAAFIARAEAELGPLYAVFANAGYGLERAIHDMTEQELREIFETNFWGSLNVIRPALRGMLERSSGHVLWCSSCLSKVGTPYSGAYSATKAAQDHLGRAMRHELKGRGLRVSTVHPVGTRTELWEVLERRSGGTTAIAGKPNRMFLQSAEHVADAVVKCLRRPRGEVWTSPTVRLLFALLNAAPQTGDMVLGWVVRRRLRAAGKLPA